MYVHKLLYKIRLKMPQFNNCSPFVLLFGTLATLLVSCPVNSQEFSVVPRLIGSTDLPGAAYMEAYLDQGNESTAIGDRWSLYVSTFIYVPNVPDSKFVIRGLGSQLFNVNNWVLQQVGRTSLWPNNPDPVPYEVFNTHALVWTSGFIPPGKRAGSLELYDINVDPPQRILNIAGKDASEWAYHRAIWKDMDGDGDLDLLTARFYKPVGAPLREFLWMENPGVPLDAQPSDGWDQHVLLEGGADVHFEDFQVTSASTGEEYDCIFAAEFFIERLAIYYVPKTNGNWSEMETIVLEPAETNGLAFDVMVEDFNRDGKKELMVTTYNVFEPETGGSIFVYEIPDNFPQGNFTKRIVAQGFHPNNIVGGAAMSPGTPKTFYPSKAYEEERLPDGRQRKPYIIVSGDDDGNHYILEPLSESPNDWSYEKHILIETNGTTTGKFAIGDFDGDGYTDIVAAGYSVGKIYAFTYAP